MPTDEYLHILKCWEKDAADPAIYEKLDELLPAYGFVRVGKGSEKDHWASPLKIDLCSPKTPNREKTVVYAREMRLREQGEWNRGVSVIDKIMGVYGLSTVFEAYSWVSGRLGLDMPRKSPGIGQRNDDCSKKEDILAALADYFAWNLAKNKNAKAAATRRYLNETREFTPDQIKSLGLGFAPAWQDVVRYILSEKRYYPNELEQRCGVRNEKGYTAVGKTHTLAIPYRCGGVIKGFLFRRIDDNLPGPKYIATRDLDRTSSFFNIPERLTSENLTVVEGELDALKASAEGVGQVVAIGGSDISGDRRLQLADAFRRGAGRITLCLDLDPDHEGNPNIKGRHEHIMRSIHTIKDIRPEFDDIYIALFPSPDDPDSYIRKNGADAFRLLIDSAVPYWTYLNDYMQNR